MNRPKNCAPRRNPEADCHEHIGVDLSAPKKPILASIVGPQLIARFQCLAEQCPDTCCRGWRIPVSSDEYRAMRAGLVKAGEKDPGPPAKSNDGLELPQGDQGCSVQTASGLCTVHALLGVKALPQICADFPRVINRIDNRLEVTGDLACPEVARILLTEPGSEQVMELPDSVLTQRPMAGLNTDSAQPYGHVLNEVRGFIITLLSLDEFTPTERIVAAHIFCAHTVTHLHTSCTEQDLPAVFEIMNHLSDRVRLRALTEMVMAEPIAGRLALPVLHHVVRLGASTSPFFKPLSDRAYDTYKSLDDPEHYDELWSAYELRRAMVSARIGQHVDAAFWRMAHHDWIHAPYVLSPSLISHAVRLQLPLAVTRWLLFAQPSVVQALEQDDDIELKKCIDATMVDVAYKTARAVQHSNLLEVSKEIFEKFGIDYAAASLLLARL